MKQKKIMPEPPDYIFECPKLPPIKNNSFIQTVIAVLMVIAIFIAVVNDAGKKKAQEQKLKQEQYEI